MGRLISAPLFITAFVAWSSVVLLGCWVLGSLSSEGLLALLAAVLQECAWLWRESGWSLESRGVSKATRVALGFVQRLAPAVAAAGLGLFVGVISVNALVTLLPAMVLAVAAAPVLLGMRSYGRAIPWAPTAFGGLIALSLVWETPMGPADLGPARDAFQMAVSRSLAGAAFLAVQLMLLDLRRARTPRG
ncbi:MAG: hypothetical protein JNJ88_18045 [Planctomycetes bacterium]|nr:hypothetical protein [Planctomycetota bacterium]